MTVEFEGQAVNRRSQLFTVADLRVFPIGKTGQPPIEAMVVLVFSHCDPVMPFLKGQRRECMAKRMNEFVEPTQEEIATCAYLIFNQNGRVPGHDMEYWLQAEAQLMADRLHDAGVPFTIEALHRRGQLKRSRSRGYSMSE